MLVNRNWLKEYLVDDIPSTEEISDLLMLHSFEIEGVSTVGDDAVIDVDILPNRASDCLSHRGIAREIAVLTNKELKQDPLKRELKLPTTDKISINISDKKACRRFGAAIMNDVSIKESPDWLRERLEAIGQRSVNNVVDATNYVMFSIGQPLHAYDADKFPNNEGVWKFGVRFAEEGEKITVLTGEEYELDPSIQLIVDETNNVPAGLAGVKGGKYAEIDENTKSIILEAANFDPTITRKASQRLRLQTDASKRFENEPSRDLVPYALLEVVELIKDIAGGECIGYVDEYPESYENKEVEVSLSRINSLLGISLTEEEVTDILNRLGFNYSSKEDGILSVKAPFERTDINIEEDVIEEVGRIHGYDHVKAVVPDTVPLQEYNQRHFYSEKIRELLINEGFSEVITSSFRKKDSVRLRNALASDKGCLRSSLRKNIKEVLDTNILNIELLGLEAVKVFEIGTVFYKSEDDVKENFSIAIGVRTKKQGHVPKDNEVLSEAVGILEKELNTKIEFKTEEGIVELNLSDLISDLPEINSYDNVDFQEEIAYKPYSQYPYISRDFALWVPEDVEHSDIENIIKENAGELLIQTSLFDEFKKDGRVSYAFRLIFQSFDRTLTDEEVGEAMDKVSKEAEKQGYELR